MPLPVEGAGERADGRPGRAAQVDVRGEPGAGGFVLGFAVRAVDDVAELRELLGVADHVGAGGRAVAGVELRRPSGRGEGEGGKGEGDGREAFHGRDPPVVVGILPHLAPRAQERPLIPRAAARPLAGAGGIR